MEALGEEEEEGLEGDMEDLMVVEVDMAKRPSTLSRWSRS